MSAIGDEEIDDITPRRTNPAGLRIDRQDTIHSRYPRLLKALGAQPDAAERDGAERAAVGMDEEHHPVGDEVDQFIEQVLEEDERSKVRLDDVGGMDEAKRRLETSLLGPMRNPDLRAAFRSTLRGGLLMYGPPGYGKTFLARAIAGELGARFVHVGLHDVLDMWLGNSEKRLHEVFEHARRYEPTVLFFDEVDALGLKRSIDPRSSTRGVSAQLLEELDGASASNDGVFVVGATNAPWDVDPALSFDGLVGSIEPSSSVRPTCPARGAILEYHLRDRPSAELDLASIAKAAEGFSGADLRLVCESAAELALEESISASEVVPISQTHLQRALRQCRPSIGAWLEVARNVVAFANQTGDDDELADYLQALPRSSGGRPAAGRTAHESRAQHAVRRCPNHCRVDSCRGSAGPRRRARGVRDLGVGRLVGGPDRAEGMLTEVRIRTLPAGTKSFVRNQRWSRFRPAQLLGTLRPGRVALVVANLVRRKLVGQVIGFWIVVGVVFLCGFAAGRGVG